MDASELEVCPPARRERDPTPPGPSTASLPGRLGRKISLCRYRSSRRAPLKGPRNGQKVLHFTLLIRLEQADGRFPNYVPVEFTQERCSLADGFKVGDEVEVTYRLRGRRWDRDGEAKYFVNVEAVDVRRLAQAGTAGAEPDSGPDSGVEDDDIPF